MFDVLSSKYFEVRLAMWNLFLSSLLVPPDENIMVEEIMLVMMSFVIVFLDYGLFMVQFVEATLCC